MPHEPRLWDRVSATGFALAAGYFALAVAVYALTVATTSPSNVGLDWIPFYLLTMPWSLLFDRIENPDLPWTLIAAWIAWLAGIAVNTAAIYVVGSKILAAHRGLLLTVLMFLASAVAWWPSVAIQVPIWIPFGCVVVYMCLLMSLAPSSWALLMLAGGVGTFGGLFVGFAAWPPDDPIAGGYVPIFAVVVAAFVMLAGYLGGAALRWLSRQRGRSPIQNLYPPW